jgi:TfoX/Sxy family transcriptional regulator of competence genes
VAADSSVGFCLRPSRSMSDSVSNSARTVNADRVVRLMAEKTKVKAKTKRPMPKFTKAPQDLVDRFVEAIETVPDVQQRKMFGYPAAFTNAQMFACLFGDAMILRLSEPNRAALHAEGWRAFEPMPGRPMREYMAVPALILGSRVLLTLWVQKAHAYAASLSPKPKPKR